jgi:hypothetical protein
LEGICRGDHFDVRELGLRGEAHGVLLRAPCHLPFRQPGLYHRVFATLFGVLFWEERLDGMELTGMLLIMASGIMANRFSAK